MPAKPARGPGERFLECRHYDECLDLVELRNWKSFNCTHCGIYVSVSKGMGAENPKVKTAEQNTRICDGCHQRPTIHPNSRLCSSCLGKLAWHPDKRKHTLAKRKNKEGTQDKPGAEKSQKCRDTALTIEFGKYVSVLRDIEKLAEQEVRPVDSQIIYILKKYLDTGREFIK